MNNITINGKTISHSGGSISISNGKVVIDGVEVSDLDSIQEKQIFINITGDVETKNGNISRKLF